MKNHAENVHKKLVPDPSLILVNNLKQPLHVRNSFKNKALSKRLKKLPLFFLLNPVPLNGQNIKKQKEPGTSDQSLFRLRNKFRKIPFLVMYI